MAIGLTGQAAGSDTPENGDMPPALAWLRKPILFFVIAALAVLGSRIPAISDNSEINVDESLFMAQASRYVHDMVPWRSVDTGTSGPLNVWPFALLKMMGVSLTYSLVHAMAALVLVAVVFFTWVTIRQFASSGVASLGAGALVVVICRAQQNDYVHFSSELIPVLLISAAVSLITAGLFGKIRKTWAWPVAAFLLGAAPWAKLQAAPIVLVLFLCMACLILFDPMTSGHKIRLTGGIAAAFGAVSLLMAAMLWLNGCFGDFWDSYVFRNVIYAGNNQGVTGYFPRAEYLFTRHVPFREFSLGIFSFAGLWILFGCPGKRQASREHRCFLGIAVLFSMVALMATLTPVFGFPHYDWFVFQPMVLVAAAILAIWWEAGAAKGEPVSRKTRVAPVVWLATAFALQMMPWLVPNSPADPPPFHHYIFGTEFQNRIGSLIRNLPKGKDKGTLAIWGWSTAWYVTAQMTPASRYGDCACLIDPYPLRDRFRENFMRDLEREPPAIIVDAVAPGCFPSKWDGTQRIDSFPALAEFVAKDYHLAAAIAWNNVFQPVRIYLRN